MAIIAENKTASSSGPSANSAADISLNQKMSKGGGILNLILIIILIALVILGAFLFWEKGSYLARTARMEEEMVNLKNQIESFKGQKVEVSQNAQVALAKIEEGQVRWSQVIAEINKLLPRDANGKAKLEIISYAGTDQGRIALNIVTQPAGLPPFEIVSNLIATFNNSVFFKNALIPSISKGQTETGDSTLSFVLNLDYQKPDTGVVEVGLGEGTVSKTPVKTPTNNSSNLEAESNSKVPRNN